MQLRKKVLILREEEEAFENRGHKLYKRLDKKTSAEELEYQQNLGVAVDYFDFDPAQGTPEEVCDQLNRLSIFFEYRPFSVGDGRYQIVQALMRPRKVYYPRMAAYLRKFVRPRVVTQYKLFRISQGLAESYFDSMTVYEQMREAQKLFADPATAEQLFAASVDAISKEEVDLIVHLQPADEPQIQADVEAYKRQLAAHRKIHVTGDGVKVKSRPR